MKQETLEEAAEIRYGSDQFLWAKQRDGFIEGAKWQQERSYSEEDLRASLADLSLVNPAHLKMTSNGHGEFPDSYKLTENGIRYIIEQFNKNKSYE